MDTRTQMLPRGFADTMSALIAAGNRPRIWVIGCPGAGKSTTSLALSRAYDLRYICLDELYWVKDWQRRPVSDFLSDLAAKLDTQGWIVDGIYNEAASLLSCQADLLLWVQPGFAQSVSRIIRRSSRRILSGEHVCNGNQETIWSFLKPGGMLGFATVNYRQNFAHCRRLHDNFPGLKFLIE